MASDEKPSKPSPSDGWMERIFIPTLIGGFVGGGVGLISKHRKIYGLANVSATYAANLAIVTGCYCGAREFVRASRASGPDDLMNSAIGGFGCGALLGRLQGGQLGALRYSVIFAVVGTTVDYATMRLTPLMQRYRESMFSGSDYKLPEWSPIQVLDEEALAAKRAREQKLYAQTALGNLNEKES